MAVSNLRIEFIMSDVVAARVGAHLESALSYPVDPAKLHADEPLNSLGLDSLLTIAALVGLAEDFGVDLSAYIDTLEAPQTTTELLAIAKRFHDDGTALNAAGG